MWAKIGDITDGSVFKSEGKAAPAKKKPPVGLAARRKQEEVRNQREKKLHAQVEEMKQRSKKLHDPVQRGNRIMERVGARLKRSYCFWAFRGWVSKWKEEASRARGEAVLRRAAGTQ